MSEALFGLIGTLVGGVITHLSARHAGNLQLKQRRMELEQQNQLARENADRDWKKSQLERYGKFIASFRQEEGRIVEMGQLLGSDAPDWVQLYNAKTAHPSHDEGVIKLNSGLAWIELTCGEPAGISSTRALSDSFESMARCIAIEARRKHNGETVQIDSVEKELQNLRSRFDAVCSALRSDVLGKE